MANLLFTAKENVTITWFNDATMGESSDIEMVKGQIEQSIGNLSIFDDAVECIQFINKMKDNRIILILGPSTGARVLRDVLNSVQLRVVFVVCPNESVRPAWITEYKSTKCIAADCTSICQQIEIFIAHNTIGIEILNSPIPLTNSPTNENKQDIQFMYSQLIKYILTEMTYYHDDMDDMIKFFENKFQHDPQTLKKIQEFRNNYKSSEAVFSYTNYTFLYTTLNLALRMSDVCALYSMRVFLRDLHLQIAQLHENKQPTEPLELYRGLVMPTAEFEKIKDKKGKLLSFNNFLSTSMSENVALMFADPSEFNDQIGIIFKITIDPSASTSIAFSCINDLSQFAEEDEYLFTMGSIFRIQSIERLNEKSEWCVNLTLTTDRDPEIVELTKYMQSEFQMPSILSFYQLLDYMGKYDEARDILDTCFESCKTESLRPLYHMALGCSYIVTGSSQRALEILQSSSEQLSQLNERESEDHAISRSIISFANFCHGKWDAALANIQTNEQNAYKRFNPGTNEHTIYCAILGMQKGCVLQSQGRFADGLECQTKSYDILRAKLPSRHRMHTLALFTISCAYKMNNKPHDASLCMKKINEIQRDSLTAEDILNVFLEHDEHYNLPSDYSINGLSYYIRRPLKLLMLYRHLSNINKNDEALLVLSQYIKYCEKNSITQDSNLAFAYYFRGCHHALKGSLMKALHDFRQSYRIAIQCYEKTHHLVLYILMITIRIHLELNDIDQALITVEQCKNVIAMNNELSSAERKMSLFQDILTKWRSKAFDQFHAEEYDKALSTFKSYLNVQIYILSEDHFDVCGTHLSIAEIYCRIANYRDALCNYEKARSIFEKYVTLKYDDALFAFNKYLKFEENALPLDYIDIANSYKMIACVYATQDNYSVAVEYYHRALIIQLEYLPETCLEAIETFRDLGYALEELHDYERSLENLYECLKYQLNILPCDHIDLLKTYKSIARIYENLGRYEEALENLHSCLLIQMSVLPSDHPDITDTQERMVKIILVWVK